MLSGKKNKKVFFSFLKAFFFLNFDKGKIMDTESKLEELKKLAENASNPESAMRFWREYWDLYKWYYG